MASNIKDIENKLKNEIHEDKVKSEEEVLTNLPLERRALNYRMPVPSPVQLRSNPKPLQFLPIDENEDNDPEFLAAIRESQQLAEKSQNAIVKPQNATQEIKKKVENATNKENAPKNELIKLREQFQKTMLEDQQVKKELFEKEREEDELRKHIIEMTETIRQIESVSGNTEDKETLENIESQKSILLSLQLTAINVKNEINRLNEARRSKAAIGMNLLRRGNDAFNGRLENYQDLQDIAISREIEIAKQRVKMQDQMAKNEWDKKHRKEMELKKENDQHNLAIQRFNKNLLEKFTKGTVSPQLLKFREEVTTSKLFFNVTTDELDNAIIEMNRNETGPFLSSTEKRFKEEWQNLPYFIRHSENPEYFVVSSYYYRFSKDYLFKPEIKVMEGLFRVTDQGFQGGGMDEDGKFDPENYTFKKLEDHIKFEVDADSLLSRIMRAESTNKNNTYSVREKDNFILVNELAKEKMILDQYIIKLNSDLAGPLEQPEKQDKNEKVLETAMKSSGQAQKSKDLIKNFEDELLKFSAELDNLNLNDLSLKKSTNLDTDSTSKMNMKN